jgi:hypothetical protein
MERKDFLTHSKKEEMVHCEHLQRVRKNVETGSYYARKSEKRR